MNKPRSAPRKRINLALQGGGSHGAFTWGVLDRILADERLEIAAISGTSAGAMNAVVLAHGHVNGGAQQARQKLEEFWRAVSEAARCSPVQRAPLDYLMGTWSMENSVGYQAMDAMTRTLSPYQFNPLNIDPLKKILESCVDFDCVQNCTDIQLYISATNVETGRVKVFDSNNLTADMVMASACLPQLSQAVVIDGVPYWDGGYMGNPVLFPFHHHTDSADIVVVQINPIERKGVPRTPMEIQNRVSEITFNASLLKELRSIEFVDRLLEAGKVDGHQYRREFIHIIENQEALRPLGASSKLNAEWGFLCLLRDIGRQSASTWLEQHYDDIGQRNTVDLKTMFQGQADR
ncbi:patatin-like phospholipase family protein [Granulosicoccus sp. 3-233]|uniref:patatin-like phospholipase family protein n=1 Tax=Granulosicoccus sp. 3-233 TaxID=3417969 RepID=UPI003D3372E2